MGYALALASEFVTDWEGEAENFGRRNIEVEVDVHGEGSQGGRGHGQGQVYWNQGYRRGEDTAIDASPEVRGLAENISG